MTNSLAYFPWYPLTSKISILPFLAPRLLAPWPAPPKRGLPITQAQKRGIADGQQAQEAQAEAGDETGDGTDRNTGRVATETAPGDARINVGRILSPQKDALRRRHQSLLRLKRARLRHVRYDYVSLGSRLGRVSSSFSTPWNVRISQLKEKYREADLCSLPERPGLNLAERPMKDPWARQVAAALAVDVDRFKKVWSNLDLERKRTTWPLVMHWALAHYPERALSMLYTTLPDTQYTPPPYAIADCLDYLACVFLTDSQHPDPVIVKHIRRIVSFYVERSQDQTANFKGVSQRTLWLLNKHCHGREQVQLYETIRQCKNFVHKNTLLRVMAFFVEMGRLATAMEILQRIVESGANLKWDEIQMGCANILRGSSDLEDDDQVRFRIRSNMLAQMLEWGLPPNLMMYNVIILNAVEAGHMKMAWRIYGMVKASKFEPNAYTYSILLKGIKHGMDEIQAFKLFQRAKDAGLLSQDHYLIGQLLHATLIYRSNDEGFRAFTDLVPIYEEYLNNQPLKDLGLLRAQTDMASQPQVELMQPSVPALGITVTAYMMEHRDSDHIPALYARYRNLVEASHPVVAPLAETDHLANAFIKALGRYRENLPLCTTVIEHMIKPPASVAAKHAAPTVQTWSVLLRAFMVHRQAAAAEKIVQMMRGYGLEPNQVTWNTLLSGYAHMQDVEKSVGATRRMQRAGYTADDWTLRAWGRVVDRRKLIKAFEGAVKEEAEAEAEAARAEQASSEHNRVDKTDDWEAAGEDSGSFAAVPHGRQ
ncbi:MAG: hypothetical protein FRX48_08310 [Lasallia pustulata]|uniref:Pentatricopeptide repeat n=1 Tax=Lasallia pustulata TaxID=136370 RepID=A0A5M8PF72_9LECA|nr:MAG: hypothetical protein FRX48_08310 [Lasallia pustulata]